MFFTGHVAFLLTGAFDGAHRRCMMKSPHAELIDKIPRDALVQRFGLSRQTLYTWRLRGVPLIRRVSFAKLAADHGLVPPSDFFDELAQ